MYRCTTKQQRSYIKIMHNLWATNYHLSRLSNIYDQRCCQCQRLYEDSSNIFQCPSNNGLKADDKYNLQYHQALCSLGLSKPMIKSIIVQLLRPLVKWLPVAIRTQEWLSQVNPFIHQGYIQHNSVWNEYQPHPSARHKLIFREQSVVLLSNSLPITILLWTYDATTTLFQHLYRLPLCIPTPPASFRL